MLWRAAAAYEADPQQRQDLYQEMLLAVWQALPRLRETERLRTYLARIAHNRGVSHVDRAVRRRVDGVGLEPDELASAGAGPEGQLEAQSRQARLQAAVRELPLAWQQVVTLTLEGFTPREVADVLGLSANVVSIRLTRAKQALAERLRSET